jgi:hypothetical protein
MPKMGNLSSRNHPCLQVVSVQVFGQRPVNCLDLRVAASRLKALGMALVIGNRSRHRCACHPQAALEAATRMPRYFSHTLQVARDHVLWRIGPATRKTRLESLFRPRAGISWEEVRPIRLSLRAGPAKSHRGLLRRASVPRSPNGAIWPHEISSHTKGRPTASGRLPARRNVQRAGARLSFTCSPTTLASRSLVPGRRRRKNPLSERQGASGNAMKPDIQQTSEGSNG